MARRRYVRKMVGRADGGSAWISYSDMMAALLLVFVLVLCYSLYQYFVMLETKTAELDEKGLQLTAQEQQLSAQGEQLSVQQATLTAQQATLTEQEATLAQQRQELTDKESALLENQNALNSALTDLDNKNSLLNEQSATIAEREQQLVIAQNELARKEGELIAANAQLEANEAALANASLLLGQQQAAMNTQQQRLDDLVGVRTKIIRELSSALSANNLSASVDKNTGDIVLESTVFFDTGKFQIKAEGQQLLNQFLPVYLGVLLNSEYADYLGEIIIEGHTDNEGTYLDNLKLSQDRALSVATFCLRMNGLDEAQREMLRSILTAKGRSYSDLIRNPDGTVNMQASRRVEFKFRLKDSEMIDDIRQILSVDSQ